MNEKTVIKHQAFLDELQKKASGKKIQKVWEAFAMGLGDSAVAHKIRKAIAKSKIKGEGPLSDIKRYVKGKTMDARRGATKHIAKWLPAEQSAAYRAGRHLDKAVGGVAAAAYLKPSKKKKKK